MALSGRAPSAGPDVSPPIQSYLDSAPPVPRRSENTEALCPTEPERCNLGPPSPGASPARAATPSQEGARIHGRQTEDGDDAEMEACARGPHRDLRAGRRGLTRRGCPKDVRLSRGLCGREYVHRSPRRPHDSPPRGG